MKIRLSLASASKYLTLYHTTSLASAKLMRIHGIGLNMDDYRSLSDKLALDFEVASSIFSKLLSDIANDGEANGGVSFFPHLEQCIRIAKYGETGGEWKGSFVKDCLKRIARVKKIPFANLKPRVTDYTGGDSPNVVVVVKLPIEYIANAKSIGKSVELYTLRKVPPKYITEVLSLP